MIVNLVVSALTWDRWEENGLALAVSAAAWVEWLGLYALYLRRLHAGASSELQAIGRFALCAGAMVLVLAVAFAGFDPAGTVDQGAIAVFGALAGAALYAGLARWMGIPELEEAVARLRGRLRPAAGETEPEGTPANQGRLNL
jgi:peptidoglycan biosynthesis protein MviN/MurJ (putative lipid II flippase)